MKTLGENIKNKQQLHEYTLHMWLIKTLKKEEEKKEKKGGCVEAVREGAITYKKNEISCFEHLGTLVV